MKVYSSFGLFYRNTPSGWMYWNYSYNKWIRSHIANNGCNVLHSSWKRDLHLVGNNFKLK